MEVRECTKCRQIYPLTTEYFSPHSCGFAHICRECYRKKGAAWRVSPEGKEYAKRRRQTNEYQEYMRNYGKLYRKAHIERLRELSRRSASKPHNKERKQKRAKAYSAIPEVKERKREYQQQYYARPEVKERLQQYYAIPEVKERLREYELQRRADPEVKERKREYRQQYYARPEVKERLREYELQRRADPEVKERKRIYRHRRWSRKRGRPVLWNVAHQRAIFSKFGNCCAYCGSQQGLFYEGKMSFDHYIPLNAGEACPGTVPWNMVPACITCNSSKQARDPRKWLIERFGKRQGGTRAKAIEAHLARMRTEYGGEEPLTPALPPISGEGRGKASGGSYRRTGENRDD